jgi:NodT family efflux transporter outer membrane factor (OMF) lipoprotein
MKELNNRYLLLLIMIILASCKTPRYAGGQEMNPPAAYRKTPAQDSADIKLDFAGTKRDSTGINQDSAGIGSIPWKEFFTEPSLRNLIDTAIIKNNDLLVAIKNIEAAHLTLRQVSLGNLPDVNLQISAASEHPADNSLDGLSISQYLQSKHIEDYSGNISLSWEADIWGKIRNQKKEALAEYLQTREAKKVIQTNIIAGISQGYFNLLMLDKQLNIARKNLVLNNSTLQVIHLQYDAGQVTALAVQQAVAQQLVAAQLVPQLEQNIALQENALSILTGKIPGKIERNSTLDTLVIPAGLSAGIPSSMVSRRPDVKNQELELTAANARVGISKANMYPSINITAEGGINSFLFSNWFSIPASLFGTVMGGLTQPLFQRKQLKTQFELAGVEREKAVIQFRQSVLNAVGEVSNALVTIEKLKTQQEIAAHRVSTLEQAITNADLLFKNGMANYLEVITAQSNVLQSELELADIKRTQLNAVVDLYRSLGGGWE